MRLAWFRPRPATHVSDRLDDSAALVGALSSEHAIETFDESRAHDFIRQHFRAPFDLCVFELADTPPYAFVWPYLMHVPGVLRLRSYSLHDSRSEALRRQHREHDRATELAFGDWDLTAAPILASRMTVVSDAHVAARLQRTFPSARIRVAPLGMGSDPGDGASLGSDPLHGTTQHVESCREGGLTLVGVVDSGRNSLIQRAVTRARDAGAPLELIAGSADSVLAKSDIVIDVTWPPDDELTVALAGMAAARPVIVMETERTAGWPALDPQTWQPRGWTGRPPVVVSLDPRDEEHSLVLALRRLATDAALRNAVGTAGHVWWRHHATLDHAAHAWRSILEDAVHVPPRALPSNWPPHLTADGTERARALLAEFDRTVDFLIG